jgi:hypothetical protein
MGQTQAIKEAIWLKRFFSDIYDERYSALVATIIFSDNQGVIAFARNLQFHARTKYIAIAYHFGREMVQKGDINLKFTPTKSQIADGLTKALCRNKFIIFKKAIGLR